MLSVILPTIHPGGMDFIAESFGKKCHPSWDFELLVVDDYPGRVERGAAEKYLRMNGVKLGWYGLSKPRREKSICGWVNAVNTALTHVKGDFIVITQDYTTMTPDWFVRWHQIRMVHEEQLGHKRFMVSGSAIMYVAPKPEAYDDILSWPGQPEIWQQRHKLIFHPWVPGDFETFYWGFPMSFVEEINGFDERADHCGPWINNSVLYQAKALDYEHYVDIAITCQMIDHRAWDDPEKEKHLILKHIIPDSPIGMWKIAGEHMSRKDEPEWICPSPNLFSIRELRKESR